MRTRLSICLKKVRFQTEEDALLAVRKADIALRPYRCDRCGRFHLTSRSKGKRFISRNPRDASPQDGD